MAKDRKIDMVILGLLSHDNLTGYDIKKQIDGSIRFFWKGSFGSIYPALAELEKQGSVRRLKSNDGGGREKIIYSITSQGKEILKAWVRDEKASNDLKYETLMKLFFGGVESKETALRNIEVFEEQIKADLKVLQVYKANIEKALDITDKVINLGDVNDIDLSDEKVVSLVRTAYELLTDSQKAMVSANTIDK